MATEIVGLQHERDEYTFSGAAVGDIRRGLVFGLYLAAEVDRVRCQAECDRSLGRKWPDARVPREPGESMFCDIASALLWLETAAPQSAAVA